MVGEAEADDDGLDVEVGQDRDQRVLDALHDQELVKELVVRPPCVAQALLERRLLQRPHGVDHQHLEIGASVRGVLAPVLGRLDLDLGVVLAGPQRDRPPAVGVGRERPHDPTGECCQVAIVRGIEQPPQTGDRVAARKDPIALDRFQQIERLGHALAPPLDVARTRLVLGQAERVVLESVPGVGAQLAGVVILAESQLAALGPWLRLGLVQLRSPLPTPYGGAQ